jgi:hypothetical protein
MTKLHDHRSHRDFMQEESNYMKSCQTVETEINTYIQVGGRQPRNIGRDQLPAFGEADRRWCW